MEKKTKRLEERVHFLSGVERERESKKEWCFALKINPAGLRRAELLSIRVEEEEEEEEDREGREELHVCPKTKKTRMEERGEDEKN